MKRAHTRALQPTLPLLPHTQSRMHSCAAAAEKTAAAATERGRARRCGKTEGQAECSAARRAHTVQRAERRTFCWGSTKRADYYATGEEDDAPHKKNRDADVYAVGGDTTLSLD